MHGQKGCTVAQRSLMQIRDVTVFKLQVNGTVLFLPLERFSNWVNHALRGLESETT